MLCIAPAATVTLLCTFLSCTTAACSCTCAHSNLSLIETANVRSKRDSRHSKKPTHSVPCHPMAACSTQQLHVMVLLRCQGTTVLQASARSFKLPRRGSQAQSHVLHTRPNPRAKVETHCFLQLPVYCCSGQIRCHQSPIAVGGLVLASHSCCLVASKEGQLRCRDQHHRGSWPHRCPGADWCACCLCSCRGLPTDRASPAVGRLVMLRGHTRSIAASFLQHPSKQGNCLHHCRNLCMMLAMALVTRCRVAGGSLFAAWEHEPGHMSGDRHHGSLDRL